MRDEKRTANMPDRKRKYNSHSSNEVASLNAEVIAHKEVASNYKIWYDYYTYEGKKIVLLHHK